MLKGEIEIALQAKDAAVWSKELLTAGVAAEEVLLPEALLSDKQGAAIEVMLSYPDEDTAVKVLPGLPLRFDGERPQIRKAAPHRELLN